MIEHWLPSLRPTIEGLCRYYKVPLGFVVGWIDVESGGRLKEVTRLQERGYFQLMPEESKDLGLEHERLSTDSEYSLAAGLKLIRMHEGYVRSILARVGCSVVEGSDYWWRLVKLSHSCGCGMLKRVFLDAAANMCIGTWSACSGFACERDSDYLARFGHSMKKWISLVDVVMQRGLPYGVELVCAPQP